MSYDTRNITQLISEEQIKAIQEISPEQEAKLPSIRDKWIAVGLSTEPADRKAAESAADDAYRMMRDDASRRLEARLVALQSANGDEKASIEKEIEALKVAVHDLRGVPDNMKFWVQSPVEAIEKYNELMNTETNAKIAKVETKLANASEGEKVALESELSELKLQLKAGAEGLDQCCYGQHDANWLAFYETLGMLGVDVSPLEPINRIAQNCHWWWPLDEAIIFCDRMCKISRNEDNELHCEDGPAIEYRDGWGVYCWNGTRIPPHFITEKENLSFEAVQKEKNLELRRCMIEIMGEENYLQQADPEVLDEDPSYGTLLLAKVPGEDEDILMVRVINSTPEPDGSRNIYYLRVPPTIKTAREGVAWTFGVDDEPQNYEPSIET